MEQSIVRLRSCAFFKPRNLALLLALLTMISRLFFQPDSVESFDAVNYILAISHFDMSLGQPQPPGYILYILLARGLNLLTQNPHLALLLLSNIASGLAVYAIYLAAKVIFDEKTGLISTVLLASAPFFWYTGDLASPYATDLFISILFAWLAFRTMNESTNPKLPWMAAILCGLAGAFRLQTILFIFPLFIFSIRKRPFRTILGSTLLVILVFGAFFIPSILASGGIAHFRKLLGDMVPIVSSATQIAKSIFLRRFIFNTYTILNYTFLVVGDLLWPFIMIGLVFFWKTAKHWRKTRLQFLLWWLLPAWIIFFVIWVGNVATIQVTTGPFFILAAYGIQRLAGVKSAFFRGFAWASLGLIIILQVSLFTLMPEKPFGESFHHLYNYALIKQSARNFQDKIKLIQQYPADETVVFAEEFRLPQYYIPQYRIYSIPSYVDGSTTQISKVNEIVDGKIRYLEDISIQELIPPGTHYVIFFDLPLVNLTIQNTDYEVLRSNDSEIIIIEIQGQQEIQWYLQKPENN